MSNTRMLLMGLAMALLLLIAGFAVMSVSNKSQVEESATPRPVMADAINTGAAATPSSTNTSGSDSNAANGQATGQQTPQNSANPTESSKQTATNAATQAEYCPKQTELYKKDMIWYGPNSWRDYSSSFVSTINNFAGAQWVGVNVGKIICLYKGAGGNDFPVALERDNLMKKPSGENWKPDPSGYQICKSDRVEDCPFFSEVAKTNQNIYDFLQDIKKPQ